MASLRERAVVERLQKPVGGFDDALMHAAAAGYLADRATFLGTLRDQGVLTLDETAQGLPAALASAYLDIKRRGGTLASGSRGAGTRCRAKLYHFAEIKWHLGKGVCRPLRG